MNEKKFSPVLTYTAVSLITIAVLTSTIFIFLTLSTSAYDGKTVPFQFIDGENVSRLTATELVDKTNEIIEQNLEEDVWFSYNGETFSVKQRELNLGYSIEDSIKGLREYKRTPSEWEIAKELFKLKKNNLAINTDIESIDVSKLEEFYTSIRGALNARFGNQDEGIVLHKELEGIEIDKEALLKDVAQYIKSRSKPIQIQTKPSEPTVTQEELEPLSDRFKEFASKEFIIRHEETEVILDIAGQASIIQFDKIEDQITLSLRDEFLDTFMEETISPIVNKAPEEVQVRLEDGMGVFSSIGDSGAELNEEGLADLLNENLNESFNTLTGFTIEVPILEIEPVFTFDEGLKSKGIKELITVGHTTYYGSPANRMHNIRVGVSKFNGVIIPQGENFSFNTTLGEVESYTGYLPELVIKQEGTIPEYGGGLCQVSTTFYRAALFGGLDIVDRAPHSYAVSYYSQVLGHGLDATIYPPSRDLIVKNNTPGDILIQSYTDGAEAYFRFFGTDPEKEVELEGPYISNYRSPGGTQYIVNPVLETGSEKQVEKPHTGFDALWYRVIIDKEGNITREPINSQYRAVPAKIQVSPDDERVGGSSE